MFRSHLTARLFAVACALALFSPSTAAAAEGDDAYAIASGHYARGRWSLAVEEFESFLDAHPQHPRVEKAVFFCGEALVQCGKYDAARERHAEYVRRWPDGLYARQAAFRAGEAAFLGEHRAEARTDLTAFLESFPHDKLAKHAEGYLAELSLVEGDARQAVERFEAAIALADADPVADEFRLGLARAQHAAKQNDEAITTLEPLLTSSSQSIRHRARLHASALCYESKAFAESLAHSDALLADSPTPADELRARLNRGRALFGLRELDKAAETFGAACAEPTAAVEAGYWLGLSLKEQGNLDEAVERFEQLVNDHPQHELARSARYHAADGLLRAQKHDEAIRRLEAAGETGKDRLGVATRYLLAAAYQGKQRHADALRVLSGLAAGADSDLRAKIDAGRGHSLYALERFAEAIAPLKQHLQAQPDGAASVQCRSELAICYAKTSDTAQAKSVLAELKAKHPDEALLLPTVHYLAEAARQAGDVEWSTELYRSLTDDSNPDEYVAKGLAGLAHQQLKSDDLAASESTLQRLLETSDEAVGKTAMLRAATLERLERWDDALAMYAQVIDSTTDVELRAPALLAAARVHDRLRQPEQAAKRYERLVNEFPEFADLDAALYGWAWALRDLGRPDEAQPLFARVHEKHPESELWADATYRLAELLASAEPDRAASLLDDLEAHELPDNIAVHAKYLRGQLHVAGKRWKAAQAVFAGLTDAAAGGPLELPAAYWLAECHYRQAEYDRAESLLRELDERRKSESAAWTAMIPLRLAQTLAQLKRWDEASQTADRLAAEFPMFEQMEEVDYLLGRCHASQAEFDKAREAYGRVTSSTTAGKSETAAMAQWMIGESYFHQHEYDKALREYLKVEILYPYPQWQAAALLQAGKCYEQLGQPQAATELYVRLLTNFPNTEYTQEAAGRLRVSQGAAPNRS